MNTKEQVLAGAKKTCEPVIRQLAENYIVPVDKLDAVCEHTIIFVGKNFRHMSQQRIVRKIATYFKLQKKNEGNQVQGSQSDPR
ncbi:MAG: hypothetical protein ACK40M_04295 [Flavobacteriales bacterium]